MLDLADIRANPCILLLSFYRGSFLGPCTCYGPAVCSVYNQNAQETLHWKAGRQNICRKTAWQLVGESVWHSTGAPPVC